MFSHVVLFGVHKSKDFLRTPVILYFFPGLGYTLLASVPPVFALYNAMFPMMIYIILGTVRQASVGKFATPAVKCYKKKINKIGKMFFQCVFKPYKYPNWGI